MAGGYRSFAHRVDLDAPVQRVWRAFTDSRLLERWTADMIGIERAPGEGEPVAPGVSEALQFISTAIEESAP